MKKLILVVISIISLYFLYNYFIYIKDTYAYVIVEDEKEASMIEDYLVRVVSCEMPALYEDEALKAQAIASRTFYLYQGSISSTDQCYLTDEEMLDKWGDDLDKYLNKIKALVQSTENKVMYKNNKLFKSFYFSTSNGYTEDSMYVFSEGNIESVESPWDKNSKNYEYKIILTKEEIVNIIGSFSNIEIISRNDTNHVEYVLIDDEQVTGIEFRNKLGLRSTDFIIEETNGIYTITTYGYGHGVGMSQYGANELAKLGYSYEEILKYYYGDIEIKNY